MDRNRQAPHRSRWLALLMLAAAAEAHAEFSFIAKSSCDARAATVAIEQVWTEEPENYSPEAGSEIMAMDSLVKYTATSAMGEYRTKVRDWVIVCTLDRVRYELTISPWNANNNVEAMCGGGSPNVELTVRRDGRLLLSQLVFSGYCDNTWNDKLNIYSVKLSERHQSASFSVDNSEMHEPVTIEHAYAELSTLTRARLWKDLLDKLAAASPPHP
jgi:hypothetical protein